MKVRIMLSASIVFFLMSVSFAFGQEITINFNKQSFSGGDTIELNGSVEGGEEKPITLEVKDPSGQTILIRTIQTDNNGKFDLKFKLPSTTTTGMYDIIATSEVNGEIITKTESISQKSEPSSASSESSGCLIATATYGSELASQVQLLREVRDNVLFSTTSGTSFMVGFNQFYYSFSPMVSDWERQNPTFKEAVKITITPLLSTLSILNHVSIDSEQEMVGYGIGIILLNLGIYFVVPAIMILKIRSKFS